MAKSGLQWWREALDEVIGDGQVRAHPVVAHLRACHAIDTEARCAFEKAIDARARLLYDEPFTSINELFAWADITEGFLAALRGAVTDEQAQLTLIRAETAFVLAGEGVSLAERLASEISAESKDIYSAAQPFLRKLNAEAAAFHLHLALTPLRLSGGGAFAPVRGRLRLFKAMATGRF